MRIGDRLREARRQRGRSLQQIAERAGISAATLSRIETGKQSLDVDLFLKLTEILDAPPASFFTPPSEEALGELRRTVGALPRRARAELWLLLARQTADRGDRGDAPALRIGEILAQVELLRAELESMSSQLGNPSDRRRLHDDPPGSTLKDQIEER